jgi:hypothetical protein
VYVSWEMNMWSIPARFEEWDGDDVEMSELKDWFEEADHFEGQEKIKAVKWWRGMIERGVVIPLDRTLRSLPTFGNTITSVCKKQVEVIGWEISMLGCQERDDTRRRRLSESELEKKFRRRIETN